MSKDILSLYLCIIDFNTNLLLCPKDISLNIKSALTLETEPFETDEFAATPPPHLAYRVTARISIRPQIPVSLLSDTEVARLLAIPTPPPLPLSLRSSPLPQIFSPPLSPILSPLLVSSPPPVSPPLPLAPPPLPVSPTYPLGYRAAMIRLRAEAPFISHSPLSHIILSYTRADTQPSGTPPSGTPPLLPIPLPTSSPPLHLISTDYRAYRHEVYPLHQPGRGFKVLLWFVATMDRDNMLILIERCWYGITEHCDDIQETYEIYVRLDDEQTERQLMAGRLNMLYRERCAHARTALLMEREARIYSASLADRDCSLASSRPRLAGSACGDTKTDEYIADTGDSTAGIKMAPKRTTRANPANTTATTSVTNAQLKAMINQGFTNALAARDADRNTNGDDSHNSGTSVKRTERVARKSTYPNFMKCQPLNFKGTKGVVELIQWFEKMKTVFSISNCSVENQIKFSTCTLLAGALTMFPEESDKIERYVGGLLDMIHRSVVASKPNTIQEAIEIATEMMDKKLRTFAERSGEKKPYGGSKPLCAKCNYHHDGPCAPKCNKCNRVGHLARDYRSTANANTAINQRGTRADHYYDIELADERITGLNTILRGCTLNFLNHPFNIDLMLIELGSLDVIIGMDWLAKYQVVIVCAEKIICIPLGNETLIVRGDKSDRGNETRLNIISCTKTQKYRLKGCLIFLAHTTKEIEGKSEKKRLEDIPIIRNFPEVFPEDLSGIPPTRQVEFQIDLIPGDAPVAWAPYRLALSEMKELSDQL
ncbi:putative reverse transcriptase domain-containing protein [Tanacetum coccineum]